MNQTPSKVVFLVIIILGVLALIGVSSLCLTLFFRNYADPAVLTAIISISSGLVGSLGTVLVSTRSQPAGSQITSTQTTTTPPPTPPAPAGPTEVVVTNTPETPVPVETQTP